jgi:hypothetical protein
MSKCNRVIFWKVDRFLHTLAETTLEGRLEELESIAEECFGKDKQLSFWANIDVNQREIGGSGRLKAPLNCSPRENLIKRSDSLTGAALDITFI